MKESWDANAGENPGADEKTLYTYFESGNDIGQLKTVRKPGGSCDAPRKLCTSYTYDGRGRVTTVTDGRGKVTTYAYDELDRTTGVYFDGADACAPGNINCVRYTYDAEGNLTTRIDKSGTTSSRYDRLNRLTGQTLPDGTEITLTYDNNGNLLTHTQKLDQQTVADQVTYTYDKANRLKTVTDASGTIDVTVDKDGRTTKINFPGADATNVNYDFKKSGKPQSMTVKKGSETKRRFEYKYTKTIALPGGSVQMESKQMQHRITANTPDGNALSDLTYEYDADQRLVSADNSNGALPDYDYSYDKVGNITKEKKDADSTYYGYDLAGQLCWKDSAEHSDDELHTNCLDVDGATNYNHDAAGNNTGTSTSPRVYNDNSQLTTIGGVDMSYSDLGNPIRTQAGATSFVNSPLGITARKTGSQITYYTRDPNGQILSSHGTSGTVNYVSEYNGSVAALYNTTGNEIGFYRYSPYGQTTVDGTAGVANPFRYIGGYQDKDSNGDDGYYKLGARYYDGHGHFTQPDSIAGTISDPKTMTSYNYGGGDPINFSDPSGESIGDAFDAAADGLASVVKSRPFKALTLVSTCAASAYTVGSITAPLGPEVAVPAATAACATDLILAGTGGPQLFQNSLGDG